MTQEIEIIIDEPIVLTIGAQQALPDSIVLDENYVHTDNNYTDADKNKVANALTSETDPTVPSWAKQPSKPSYNKSEIGLGNVDNTSDANKPISTATQTVLNTKADKTYVDNELSQKADSSSLPAAIKANETLTAINGLSLTGNILTISYTGENGVTQTKNVDLSSLTTTDVKVSNAAYNAATNIITITNSDASTFNIDLSEFSIIASTDGNGVTTLVQEGVTKATISRVGQTGDYNDLTNKPTLGTASAQNSTAFATAAQGVKADTALQTESDPTVPAWAKQPLKPSYSKSEIGLGDVDNTSDANKPVSTATQTALNNKLNSSAVSLSAGQVGFGSGSNTIGGDNGLYWDNTNKRFAVGTTTPTEKLHVVGNGLFTGTLKIGAYTLPNTDGTANQMLRTNGSGVVSWQNSYPIEVINSSNLFSRGLSGTGSGVTSAYYSIFFGAYAGNSATNANNSNFFGANAGNSATNANNSNFFGAYAGNSATNANKSNFFGAYAGNSATNANNSNFFGYYAGNSATNANNSNFFGQAAGYEATNAYYSNLFGYQVGKTFSGNNIGGNNIIIGTNISLGDAVANSMNIGGVLFGTGFNSDTSGNPKIAPVAGGKVGVGEVAPKERLEVDGVVLSRFKTMSADPTTSDIASGYFMAVKNTSTGKLHLWANDGGTMKKIEFT